MNDSIHEAIRQDLESVKLQRRLEVGAAVHILSLTIGTKEHSAKTMPVLKHLFARPVVNENVATVIPEKIAEPETKLVAEPKEEPLTAADVYLIEALQHAKPAGDINADIEEF